MRDVSWIDVWAVACNAGMHLMCRESLCSVRGLLSWATTGLWEVCLEVAVRNLMPVGMHAWLRGRGSIHGEPVGAGEALQR